MACTSGFGTIVPAASLTGDPTTWSVILIPGTVCVLHTLGPSGSCVFEPGYKKGCCCDKSLTVSYEMPLLGFNTTAGVYMTCDGGVIPDFDTQPTSTFSLPSPTSSSLVATPTPSTTTAAAVSPTPTKSSANKNKTGMVLLLVMFTTMIL